LQVHSLSVDPFPVGKCRPIMTKKKKKRGEYFIHIVNNDEFSQNQHKIFFFPPNSIQNNALY
jgi:hypothetical protein